MKTPMSKRDEIRENSLTIPMSAEEKERLRTEAKSKGLTMASFARLILNEKMEGK